MHLFNHIFCTLLYIITNLDIIFALRYVRVQMPHAVRKGEKATLQCLYDLEGDNLYSVKWYKGRREFYSFTPKDNQVMKVFPFAGGKVDRSSSNESQLVLEQVNAATSGKYSCEVSADAPSFHTLIGAGELEVVVPGKEPVITGIRPRYKVGDIVKGNCTSSHSRPAANITWTVNNYETNPAHIRHFKPHKVPHELETVISAIHFVVTPQHFINGKLKIRCTAFIHDVYWKSTEKSIEENRFTKQGNSNVVHKFSEDDFNSDEDNVIDRSDTYMTHIKGDVSSLNASGCSALHKCSCFWPRLITLSLMLYAIEQLLQLFQQLLSQTTKNITEKSKQNTGNCQTLTITNASANKGNDTNVFKTKTTATIKQQQQQQTELNTITSLATEVSTICYENKSTEICWPKEKYFQIKLIKEKHQHQQRQQQKQHQRHLQIVGEKQWQYLSRYKNTSLPKLTYCKQVQLQLHLQSQLQLKCDKTLDKCECNLTMTTTQEANILTANIVTLALVLKIQQYICCKLYAQFCTIPLPKSCSNSLHTATFLSTCRNTGGNSALKDFLLTATTTSKQTTAVAVAIAT